MDLKPTYGWMGALPCMLYVCVPEDDDVVVGGVLLSALYCCLRPQCVKGIFLVQKLQIIEKLENWPIFIFDFFSSKQFEKFEFFVPKLVKKLSFHGLY